MTRFFAGTTILLAAINIVIQFAIYRLKLKKEWFLLFNMDKEINIPTLFSCCLLLVCAFLISLVMKKAKKQNHLIHNKWNVLKWVFVFLALDEGLQIHELLIIPSIKDMLPAIFTVVWVIPYGALSIFAIFYFFPMVNRLPKKIKYLILLAGVIYVSGALGLEIIGSFLVKTEGIRLHSVSYGLITTLEETLEMTGLIVFIHALSTYIFVFQGEKLKINFRLSSSQN